MEHSQSVVPPFENGVYRLQIAAGTTRANAVVVVRDDGLDRSGVPLAGTGRDTTGIEVSGRNATRRPEPRRP